MIQSYADLSSDSSKNRESVDQIAGSCAGRAKSVEWHIHMYMPQNPGGHMQRKAKIFMNNRNQAVRLPKDFQFSTQEVFIRKEGSEVVLSPRPFDWSSYLAEGPVASANFMEGVEDLPVQEREP
jgi:antitoxin VapB